MVHHKLDNTKHSNYHVIFTAVIQVNHTINLQKCFREYLELQESWGYPDFSCFNLKFESFVLHCLGQLITLILNPEKILPYGLT